MRPNTTETTINSSNSTFYCRYIPNISWHLINSTFHLITGVVTLIASLSTILLNTLVIVAIKQKKVLHKLSNILLSSLAVTDLLMAVVVMPLTITADVFILRQVSFEHICSLLLLNHCFVPLLFAATLYHLTIIAWERYVAVQKWIDYKVIITSSRLKSLAIAAWLTALLPTVPNILIRVTGVDRRVLKGLLTVWSFVSVACIILIALFYRKVYLGVRKLKTNEISQVSFLVKMKRESKVAKTTGLLTAVLMFSLLLIPVVAILANVFPVFGTNITFRFTEAVTQLNSLLNPLLYCYKDRRFRNAILKLVGIKIPPRKIRPAVGAARFAKRKDPFGSAELHSMEKTKLHVTRSGSCNPPVVLDSVQGTPSEAILKKSLSDPTLECSSSLDGSELEQSLSIVATSATVHSERGVQ